MKPLRMIWSITIIFFPLQLYSQQSVKDVIEKYIRAIGGNELAKIQTESRKGTLVRGAAGYIPLQIWAARSGKWYYNQVFAWGDQITYGFDGRNGWIQTTKGIEKMEAGQLLDMRLLFDIQAPLKLHEFYPEMRIKAVEKSAEKEITVIAARPRHGDETELIFDNATGLLMSAGQFYFEDYKTVAKVQRPYKILLGKEAGEEHKQMKMQFSEIRHNKSFPDSIFEQPACALPVIDAPLYISRKQIKVSDAALEACVGVYQHPKLADVKYTVTRQGNHLMLERTGWGQKVEIKPESEVDYFIRFLGSEFHFIKDDQGRIVRLDLGKNREIKAEKIL